MNEGPFPAGAGARPSRRHRVGLLLGLLAFGGVLLSPAPEALPVPAWRTAGVALLMAIWWVTEAIPIPATALVPLTVFPLLGIGTIEESATPFANPVIILLLGGFLLALGMERWGLPRRLALGTIGALGHRPSAVTAGFMIAAAFLSMWVSNTATAMMMLPIGLSVIALSRQQGGEPEAGPGEPEAERTVPDAERTEPHAERTEPDAERTEPEVESAPPGGREVANFATGLMLGIAYACSIGGLGTIVGTPPNAFAVGVLREGYGVDMAFVQWLLFALPVVAVGLGAAYLVLTRWAFPTGELRIPGGREFIRAQLAKLGPMSVAERRVLAVFGLTAALWITRPLVARLVPGLSDAGVAVTGGLLLFLVPSGAEPGGKLLTWEWARRLPWGALLLFGGGLSLAAAFQRTGLTTWVGESMGGLAVWPPILVVLVTTTVMIFLTELTSNTATAAAFLPLVASVAVGIGQNPITLVVPAALAASCAFMLPVATGPNIVVYGSRAVTIPQMARAGIMLNLAFVLLITLAVYAFLGLVFDLGPVS